MSQQEPVPFLEAGAVAYDVAMRRLDEQMRQVDAIDNKVSVVVGASSAIAALFAGFAAVAVDVDSARSLWTGVAFIGLVIVAYLPAVVFGVLAFRFYEWSFRPSWQQLLEFGEQFSEKAMQSWVACECVTSLTTNATKIASKLGYGGWSMRFLVVETVLAAAGLLSVLVSQA